MGEIAFRRIGGRIVPIRMNKQKKEALSGGALVTAGLASTVGAEYAAGRYGGRQLKKATIAGEAAISFTRVGSLHNMLGRSADSLILSAAKHANRSSGSIAKAARASKYLRGGGAALGAALAGVGISKLVNPFTKGKEQTAVEQTASYLTGTAIAGAGALVFRRGILRGFRKTKTAMNMSEQLIFKGL